MPYILVKMINMSITAGWMILAAMFLRLILKRAPKAIRYILWALVAVRLILPVSFESITSLIPSTEPVSETDLIYVPYEAEAVPYTEFDPSADPDDPVYLEMFVAEAPEETGISSDEILSLIWVCGTAAMLIYSIVSYAVLRHKVRASVRQRDNLYLCDTIGSPFILGIIRPRIYMPSGITEDQLCAVEAHERMHIRHGDHLWKILGYIILSAYWWNPLIWAAYILFCRDIELICDEAVVRKMETSDRQAYSEALLSFSMPRRLVSACPLAFGEVGVKSRIRSVLSYKKPALWIIIASIIACTVTAVCLLTDPVEKEEFDPFMYDRIAVSVFGNGSSTEEDTVRFEEIKEGAVYTLPGYGDVDKINCTVEKVNEEKKTVTLRLDHSLNRVGTNSPTDTVRLLLDHLAYDGIGFDNTTLEAPDGSGLMYCFQHVMIKGGPDGETDSTEETPPETERPIDEYISSGKLPEESAYSDGSVKVTVHGMLYTYDVSYYNSNNKNALKFYEALDVGTFVPIELEEAPELESFSVAFQNKLGDLGDYTVYEDETVRYEGRRGEENALYFKASDGTFDRLILLEERLNGVKYSDVHPSGTVISGASLPEETSERFLVDLRGKGYPDTVYLGYSTDSKSYTLYHISAASSSGMPILMSIVTRIKNYTLSLEKTAEGELRLLAEYGGKKIYYTVKLDEDRYRLILKNPDGYNDFQIFQSDITQGFAGDSDEITEEVMIKGANISERFAFMLTVKSSDSGDHTIMYIPEDLYYLHLSKDDNGSVKLIAKKNGKSHTIDIAVKDGKLILDGVPDDFGDAYPVTDASVPEDPILTEYFDIMGSDRLDAIYITGGPLSDRYSFTVTVDNYSHRFSSTYASDVYCDLELVKSGTSEIQLKATQNDGTVSLYGIKCEYVDFEVALTCVGGEDTLQEIETVEENTSYSAVFSSESADIDGDGEDETVTIGPGMYSGLSSFSITIKDGDRVIGPQSLVSNSIYQTLVKGDDGKLRLRAEYEDEVIYYEIYPESGGILADKDGNGVK